MAGPVEYRAALELRVAGDTLLGPALRYGELAEDRAEMFEPGAFVSGLPDAALNLQHDIERVLAEQGRNLTITDTPESLSIEARMRPDSAEMRLVNRGSLRGLSVGFVALQERESGGARVISRAHLDHVALVDSGSYGGRLEVRQFDNAWLKATLPYGQEMECACQGPDCTDVLFEAGAFELGDETLAVGGGGFGNVLGSKRRGTLITEDTREGLKVGLTNSQTETARRITQDAAVADVYVRPILDLEASTFTDRARTRLFSKAKVRALLVKPTPANRGHTPAEITGVPEHRGRKRIWL